MRYALSGCLLPQQARSTPLLARDGAAAGSRLLQRRAYATPRKADASSVKGHTGRHGGTLCTQCSSGACGGGRTAAPR
jgi:hypothetical protein